MNAIVRVLMVKGDMEWLAQSNPEGLEKVKTWGKLAVSRTKE